MAVRWRALLRILFPVICLLVIFSQCLDLEREHRENEQADREYETWAHDTKEEEDGSISVDFESLQKRNPDIVAWIRIPDTTVNYPVVQGRDNTYYLHHTAAREENRAGAIFLDAGCDTSFTRGNYIIYGHNMRNRKMFGILKELYDPYYNEEASFAAHPDIVIDTPGKRTVYHVFSVRRISLKHEKDVYMIHFSDEAVRREYLRRAEEASLLPGSVITGEEASILTLSTCTSDSEDGRLVVQACEVRRIR